MNKKYAPVKKVLTRKRQVARRAALLLEAQRSGRLLLARQAPLP
ncbi:MAG: hypothetical protein ACJ8F1_06890 [Polyangia bacterium]